MCPLSYVLLLFFLVSCARVATRRPLSDDLAPSLIEVDHLAELSVRRFTKHPAHDVFTRTGLAGGPGVFFHGSPSEQVLVVTGLS